MGVGRRRNKRSGGDRLQIAHDSASEKEETRWAGRAVALGLGITNFSTRSHVPGGWAYAGGEGDGGGGRAGHRDGAGGGGGGGGGGAGGEAATSGCFCSASAVPSEAS